MEQILIIGGGGFIGRHVTRRLVADGCRIFSTHRAGTIPPVVPGAQWLPCDLADRTCSAAWPRQIDAVIYLAQSSAWRSFAAGSQDVFAVNVAGLMQAVHYADGSGAQSFIYTSSGSVAGAMQNPSTENEPNETAKIVDFYSASKLAGEILLRPYVSRFATQILRLFTPYGCGLNPSMLLARLINRVHEGIPIQLHGENGLLASPVAIVDVVEAIVLCLRLGRSATLNVAGPQALALRTIGETIGHIVGRPPVFESSPDAPVPVIVGDTTVLRNTLAWTPRTTLVSGLQQWMADEHAGLADNRVLLRNLDHDVLQLVK